MAANMKAVKLRIKSVESTMQITKADRKSTRLNSSHAR